MTGGLLGRLTNASVLEAARRFVGPGVVPEPVNLGVNHVYRCADLALRFTHSGMRDEAYLTPPLAWLRHLEQAGAPVCAPRASRNGKLIEQLQQDDDTFLVTAVQWVTGPRLSALTPTEDLYHAFGRSIGQLHRLTEYFALPPGTAPMIFAEQRRPFPEWAELWHRAAPDAAGHPTLRRAFERLTPEVDRWSNSGAGFGLMHGDLRPGNAIWDGQRAVIIDFDEPVWAPLANDLARAALELSEPVAARLLPHLIAGYRTELRLEEVWVERLPLLTAARCALMAAWSVGDGSSQASRGSGAVVSVDRLVQRLERWLTGSPDRA
ncbi:phosphotransferase enzyme family protein [Deinococcus sonorensis]|uniref:Phosphotransferase n=2 Tax=Deinococcus sonorensis TaxID=309891 RepID=A0AAU7UA93_9DEIO